MPLPTTKTAAKVKSPKLLTLYGQSKVGKTTKLAELDNCLIIDTEEGTDFIEAYKVNVGNLNEFKQVMIDLKQPHNFKYAALDTVDNLALWHERAVCAEHKVTTIGDIPYGAGYSIVRERVMAVIAHMKRCVPHVIVIGHLKKTLIGTDTVEVNTSSLDLTGKLKNLIMADSDAIGIVYREEGDLKVSFAGSDELEVGSRCEHLRGQVLPFEWKNIYV